jgi:hypothetical protein
MDNFPSSGYGVHDTYEVYGNFFYNNPTEALMQVTGNTTAYNNVFVNHVAPSGYEAVVITNHNGFPPRLMNMFHNTVLTSSDAGGIGLFSPDPNYPQYCYANAVFSDGTPISGFSGTNEIDNITDTYAHADSYVKSPSIDISSLDLYPLPGQLQGGLTAKTLFINFTDYDIDFNGDPYDWHFRGAYSGSGINHGWDLQLDIRPTPHGTVTGINESYSKNDFLGVVYPNPTNGIIQFNLQADKMSNVNVMLSDLERRVIKKVYKGDVLPGMNTVKTDLSGVVAGFYLLNIQFSDRMITRKIMIQK